MGEERHMEKRKWYGMALAVAAVGVVAGVAVQKSKKQNNIQQYEAKFAFIAPKRWSKIARGVALADRERGSLTKCILYTQDEASSQTEALRYALLSGADGIITGGMEPSPDTEAVIREAREKGVPVVYVDSDLEESARSCYIGSDNYEVGRMAGEFLAKEQCESAGAYPRTAGCSGCLSGYCYRSDLRGKVERADFGKRSAQSTAGTSGNRLHCLCRGSVFASLRQNSAGERDFSC